VRNNANNGARSIQISLRGILGITAAAAFLAVISQGPYSWRDVNVPGICYFSVLIVIYVAKFFICRSQTSRVNMLILFGLLLLAVLPYIYYYDFWNFTPFFGKWLGTPIGVFAVPTSSFLLFDTRRIWCTPRRYSLRSAVELLVVLPAWWYVWALLLSDYYAGGGFGI
jgi:hypothetical protein